MSTSVGTISLDMVLNGSKFKKQLGNVQNQANAASQKMAASFKKIGAAVAAAFSVAMVKRFGEECINLANIQTEAETKLTTIMKQRMQATDKSIQKIKDYASAQQQLGVVGDEVQLAGAQQLATFLKTDEALKELIPAMNNLAVQQNGVNVSSGSMVNIGNLMGKVMQGQTSALTRVGITFDEAQEKVLKYGNEQERAAMLAQVITDNVGEMNKAIASTPAGRVQQLKNSFGDVKEVLGRALNNVFMPLLKYINSAIQSLSVLSTKFEEFTAKMFGNANNSVSSLADTSGNIESLTDEASNTSSALDSVADSAEKAKKSVAGFDKLNILSQETKTETNSTTPTTSTQKQSSGNNLTSAMSKSVDKLVSSWNSKGQKVIDSIKKAFNSVKSVVQSIGESWKRVWNNGSGEKLLNNVKELLKDCFDNVSYIADAFKKAWDNAGLGDSVVQSIIDRANSLIGLIDVIAEDFGKVWNNGAGERIWTNILNIIKNCNNYVALLRDKIKLAWEKGGAGEKIWNTILGIVEDITGFLNEMSQIRLEWLESLDLSPIVTAVSDLGEAFRELLKACGDKLKTAYQNILLPLAKWTIEKAVPKLVEMLADALKGISDIIKKISDKTLYAIAGGIAALGTAIVVFKAGTAIAAGINKVKDAVKVFLATISAHPILAIAGAIGGLVTAVMTYNELEWSNSEAGKFAAEIDIIKGQLEETTQGITDNLESTLDTLDSMYADNTLIDEYQKKLDELLTKAELTPEEQSQLQTIVTYFSDNVTGFDDTWKKYVEISDGGKINLKGDLEEVQGAINKTIEDYQRLANSSALSELSTENSKERISATKNRNEIKSQYDEKKKTVEEQEKKLKKWLDKKGISQKRLENYYYGGGDRNDALWKEGIDLFENISSENKSLDELRVKLNESTEEMNKLIMTGDDLSDVQKVLNGDYSDAAAVMMAYNAGMINLEDVQESQWKSLFNLEKAAKDTGKNTVIGLVEGTQEYKDALIENSNGLATTVLSQYDRIMQIHSPSKAMYQRGIWTVQGLIDGFSAIVSKVTAPFKAIIENVKTALNPIKAVFSNIFGGIWQVIKNPINTLMSNLESFVNGFISSINSMASGADWAINNIGQIFGQEWHVGQLAKVTLPRFAKGAIVKAPTLAVVGDNAGANTGDPEVISPLSKLQSMIKTSSGEDVVILKQILDYLKRIYEMFVIFRNNGGNHYEFVAKINGSEIFDEIVKQNELYKKRHGGKSAFA